MGRGMTGAGWRRAGVLLALAAAGLALAAVMRPAANGGDVALPAAAPGDGPLTLAVLGTSLSLRATWPDAVAARLSDCLGREVRVAVTARAGAASDWGVTMADSVLAARPDVVIVEFMINDGDLRDGLWPAASRANHREIVRRLRDLPEPPQVVLLATNPVGGIARATRPFLPRYYEMSAALSREMGLAFLDGTARWQGPDAPAAGADGVHPDPAAETALYAGALAGLVAPGLGGTCSGGG